MKGSSVLQALMIPTPDVEFSGGTAAPLSRLLTGHTIALAGAARAALEGGALDPLIEQIERASIWPPMASGVRIAAEVAGHLSATRRQPIPQRTPDQ